MADAAPGLGWDRLSLAWEQLAPQVFRTRLSFCDVTVGLVAGAGEVLLIDTGTTLLEAEAVAADVRAITGHDVGHVVLTHNHFDHILGSSAFAGARFYCAPAVLDTMATAASRLRTEALEHGADRAEVDRALAALAPPADAVSAADLRIGAVEVSISHPGRGHTDHDLVVAVTGTGPGVVFCGDLVEESGDPCFDQQSDPAQWPATLQRIVDIGGESARYVPGHGAVVDADFVRRQAAWLTARR